MKWQDHCMAMAGSFLSMSFTRVLAQKRGHTFIHCCVCRGHVILVPGCFESVAVWKYRNLKRLLKWAVGSVRRLRGKAVERDATYSCYTSYRNMYRQWYFKNNILYKGSKVIPENHCFILTEVNNNNNKIQILIMKQQISVLGKFGLDFLIFISTFWAK